MAIEVQIPAKWPGQNVDTVFLMQNQHTLSFVVEPIDKNVFELTICTYMSENTKEKPEIKRKEWVLHANKEQLQALAKIIGMVTK